MNEWMFSNTPARKTDRLLGVSKRMEWLCYLMDALDAMQNNYSSNLLNITIVSEGQRVTYAI